MPNLVYLSIILTFLVKYLGYILETIFIIKQELA